MAKIARRKAHKDVVGEGAPKPRRGSDLPPEISIGYIVREVHRAYMRSLESRIGQHGITSGMWWFLRLLWIEDGVSQADLSERLKVMGPTTVRAMDRLERFKLIRRENSPDDKRKAIIRLTDAGRALKSEMMPLAIEVHEMGTAALSADEIQTLRMLLGKVQAGLDADQAVTYDDAEGGMAKVSNARSRRAAPSRN